MQVAFSRAGGGDLTPRKFPDLLVPLSQRSGPRQGPATPGDRLSELIWLTRHDSEDRQSRTAVTRQHFVYGPRTTVEPQAGTGPA